MLTRSMFVTRLMTLILLRRMTSAAFSASPKYNFGAATSKLPFLFGVEAPGTPKKPDGLYNEKGSVPSDVGELITDWSL